MSQAEPGDGQAWRKETNTMNATNTWKAVTTHGEGRSIIAVMAEGPTQLCVMTEGTFEQAKLMAAAPEVMAALKEVSERLLNWMEIADKEDRRKEDYTAIKMSVDAIAKAEGN